MRDFTSKAYILLIESIQRAGYSIQTFEQFIKRPQSKIIIIRHDVDLRPQNSLEVAKIEYNLRISGSYYFRIVKESNNPDIIKQIADLGHEIGYHYETMDSENSKLKAKYSKFKKEDLIDAAYEGFCRNLEYFRTLYPVKTICMHGSPLSKFDNRDIWEKYDYKSLGLIGEPYFDIDFSRVLYLTDTGRTWGGQHVSIRDKVQTIAGNKQQFSVKSQDQFIIHNFKHTKDIIRAISEDGLPDQVMITIHPQRWNDSLWPWSKELVMQNIKNLAKWLLIKARQPS